METSLAIHRPMLLAALLAVLAAPGSGALQEARPRSERAPHPTVFTLLTGRVQRPDGAGAPGAVVVTSLGGEAVTDGEGRFELALVTESATAFHVTAVASLGGANHSSTTLVGAASGGGRVDTGTLVLQAAGGCQPSWLATFGGFPGVDGVVHALAVFDDGGGLALYAGGNFFTAGGVEVSYVAKWDGEGWSSLGGGTSGGGVRALAVFDDGEGAALYAGGVFLEVGGVGAQRIAKWDGSKWSSLGSGIGGEWPPIHEVLALAVFDDGSGPALYAAGLFGTAGGKPANSIAKWDGVSWSPLGSGMTYDSGVASPVRALAVHHDGRGPALYAGGLFGIAGGVEAKRVAKWDGSSWSALGSGMSGTVNALATFDDGGGSALYAGGFFHAAGGIDANHVARWNGSSWAPLGSGTNARVHVLAVFDDGDGPQLHAGGEFTDAGSVAANRIARWNGSTWSPLGSGVTGGYGPVVNALCGFDAGKGKDLFAGGDFAAAGELPAHRIASWDGSSWSALGHGADGPVSSLAVFDDGSGPALYAGGGFSTVGGVPASRIAKWDGASWSPLGSGMSGGIFDSVDALAVFDDGGGPALYAGGWFSSAGDVAASCIAKWDGSRWSPLGSGMSSSVAALAVFDDGGGPALYAGGWFTTAGGVAADFIAKWSASGWAPLGSGMDWGVTALAVHDDGHGSALYAGGHFWTAGGLGPNGIAKWDGSAWASLAGGMFFGSWLETASVSALANHDDGTGPGLYAGGVFSIAGGVEASNVARWDGSSWVPLGNGLDWRVEALAVFDDGAGPALFAGGWPSSGGTPSGIARWNGSTWSPLGSGFTGGYGAGAHALCGFDDGSGGGPALFAGGNFTTALDSGDSYLAKWGCPPPLVPLPGCAGNPAALSALASTATLGEKLSLQLEAEALRAGLGFLLLGADGTGAAGCGLLVPGLGELLLALAPAPLVIAQEPLADGSAVFLVPIPADPGFAGATVALQAAGVGASPGPMVELSNGIHATLLGG